MHRRRVQWSRLPDGATPPAFIERVRSLLNADKTRSPIAAPMASPIPPAPLPQPGRAATPAPPGNRGLLIGVAVAALALVVFEWVRLRPPPGGSAPQVADGIFRGSTNWPRWPVLCTHG